MQPKSFPRKTQLFLLSILLCLSACGSASATVSQTASSNHSGPSLTQKIDAFLTKEVQARRFSGVVLVMDRKQQLLRKAYGMENMARNIPASLQTKFGIGSLTKAFTAMLVLQLQEQGKLSVQDKLCKYIDPCPQAWQAITLQHLLTHTSGIPEEPATEKRTLPYLETVPLDFQPGTHFNYSNSGYIVLGVAIEKASGESYPSLLQKQIFNPLHLTQSGYNYTNMSLPHIATGYQTWGVPATYTNIDYHFSSGAIYSTLDDMYRWDQALFSGKQSLVSAQSLQAMLSPQFVFCIGKPSCTTKVPDVTQDSYGYGWFIGTRYGRHLIYHPGDTNGFAAYHAFYPDNGVMIIVLTNLVAASLVRTQIDKIVLGTA